MRWFVVVFFCLKLLFYGLSIMNEIITPFIKYLFFFLCGTYCVVRLLDLRRCLLTSRIILFFFCAVLFSIIMCFLRLYLRSFSIICEVTMFVIFFKYLFHLRLHESTTASIISGSVCYIMYLFSSSIIATVQCLFSKNDYAALEPSCTIIIGSFQLLFTLLLFRMRRFRHGLPFFSHSKHDDIGVYISISILMASTFISMGEQRTFIFPILLFSLFLCAITLFFWYRSLLTREYLEQLKIKERAELRSELLRLNKLVNSLRKDNDELAKIVHRDNKLIPALCLAVQDFLVSAACNENKEERISSAQFMLNQIMEISKERAGIIANHELSASLLPHTNIISLDAILSYMVHKAKAHNIDFRLNISDEIQDKIASTVSTKDLSTILADLIDNSIIASNYSQNEKRISVEIGQHSDVLYIRISDNGIPFPKDVIDGFGVKKITTHADDGGSGIGMISIHEICERYQASFSIESFECNPLFAKRIAIYFDGKASFSVVSL